MISFETLQLHKNEKSCWIVIHGFAYDITKFLSVHPGGRKILVKYAGNDATAEFQKYHSPNIVDFLEKEYHLGPVDLSSFPKVDAKKSKVTRTTILPPISAVLNLFDFENLAKSTLSAEGWAYYSSGGEDELSLRENHQVFNRVYLKPRVLVNVKKVDLSTTFFKTKVSMPIYVTATALGKLGHPEGEVILTMAAGTRGVIQMIPTLASCSLDEMINAAISSQTQWFQLYVNCNRDLTRSIIQKAENAGVKAICVTVDAPQLGRREKDMRVKFEDDAPAFQTEENLTVRNSGAARAISTFIDPSLSWSDIPWLKASCRVPLLLKGIQSGEDAVIAASYGVDGIIVSNHGGRQLGTVRSGLEILQEVVKALKDSGNAGKMEIYMDGGIRRGADIFKALAIGASGCGLGRPFLYAMSTYGQSGVEKAIDILYEELEMVMRLMGVTSIKDINANHVVANELCNNRFSTDALSESVYQKMSPLSKL